MNTKRPGYTAPFHLRCELSTLQWTKTLVYAPQVSQPPSLAPHSWPLVSPPSTPSLSADITLSLVRFWKDRRYRQILTDEPFTHPQTQRLIPCDCRLELVLLPFRRRTLPRCELLARREYRVCVSARCVHVMSSNEGKHSRAHVVVLRLAGAIEGYL